MGPIWICSIIKSSCSDIGSSNGFLIVIANADL
jgi:hypothetical protein